MLTLKCKMCGGELTIEDGVTVCECEYCGSKQTVPTVDDEKIIKLYDRANRFRMANEFDKAATVYESIINENDSEAEAYWGLMLCKYGIEYVDDPATGNKIPTCHRSSFDSFMDDEDFEMVMSNSDALSRSVYREQAKQIEEIRKGIIEVSGKEQPYDIFICYKETDENGDRTLDSVIAQDVYDVLVGKGYRVFFSRITLEDKLGTEYEPYIFAALNSAKVMLAFGTSYDYYNAVWVKNEWSRFLKIMAKDKTKYLIPCYKDIDAYDMPKEFAKLQAQDMGKVGAIQDLVRGIDKITGRNDDTSKSLATPVVQQAIGGTNVDALIQRGFMALEDKEWEKADGFFEDALNHEAQNAQAYLGKLLAEYKKCKPEDLSHCEISFEKSKNYEKVLRFCDNSLKQELEQYIDIIKDRNSLKIKEEIYNNAIYLKNNGNYSDAIIELTKIRGFKDAISQIEECEELRINVEEKNREKQEAVKELNKKAQITANEITSEKKNLSCLDDMIRKLNNENYSLGIFAGKRKKEITFELNSLWARKKQKESEISELCENLDGTLDLLRNCVDKNTFVNNYKRYVLLSKGIELEGDRLFFGKYKNKKIEWRILLKNNLEMVVLSEEALECMPYNKTLENVTWENCSLRKWLNNDFLDRAFNSIEKSVIKVSKLDSITNKMYMTVAPDYTNDKVFLLNINDAEKYLKNDVNRLCRPAESAIKAFKSKGSNYCWWWLSSPGETNEKAANVPSTGSINYSGSLVDTDVYGVRPALKINLEKLFEHTR